MRKDPNKLIPINSKQKCDCYRRKIATFKCGSPIPSYWCDACAFSMAKLLGTKTPQGLDISDAGDEFIAKFNQWAEKVKARQEARNV